MVKSSLILGVLGLVLVTFATSAVTEKSSPTGIVLIGDSGQDNQGQLDVANAMKNFCLNDDCDLGILAGDNVYEEGLESENDKGLEVKFDKFYNPLNLKFLIALGNHDYGKFTRDWKRGRFQIQHHKKNPSFRLPHYYYMFEAPETVFAVIDSNKLMWRKETFIMGAMLDEAYKKAQRLNKWFIVVGHHPYLSNGKHGNAGRYDKLKFPYFISGSNVKAFLDRYVCGKAQFYLSGHDHSLQVFDGNIKGCDTQLVVSGAAATAHKMKGKNPSLFQKQEIGFFHLSISSDTLYLRALNANQQVLFEKSYPKN